MLKTRTVLTCGCIAKTSRIPGRNQMGMTWRNQSLHVWINRLQGGIAAAMVAVQVGVEQQIWRLATQCCLNQCQRLR